MTSMISNKRQFVQAAFALGGFAVFRKSHGAAGTSTRTNMVNGTEKKLVVIMLRGALDGLSAIVPYGDPAYYQHRGSIALARPGEPDGVLELDSLFGLHPAMASLLPYWQQGSFSFVHSSGSPDATRSHFDAQDYMEAGTPGRKSTPDGWMNRLLSVLQAQSGGSDALRQSNLRAINLGPLLPRIYAGPATVASVASGAAAGRAVALDRDSTERAFAKLYSGDDALSKAFREANATRRQVAQASQELEAMTARQTSATEVTRIETIANQANNGALALSVFSQDAQRLGQLFRRDSSAQLAFLALGGWDTHVAQGAAKGQLANKLGQLADGLHVLAQALGDQFAHTNIVVMSEFGRTVRQNGNNGTDHGHGNVCMLLGGNIKGGRTYGAWPGLENAALHEGRDLAITTDFRAILAQLLRGHLKLSDSEIARVLPDYVARQNASEWFLRS
jgi:uncharacterized protein (DUF1501 family)